MTEPTKTDLWDGEHIPFPPLVPLNEDDIPAISPESFLAALKEEAGIKEPEALHRNCYEAVKALRSGNFLDKYVLNEDEAAVICAIPNLLEETGDLLFKRMVESCKEKAPSKLLTIMLSAVRKLPRYTGVMYIEEGRKGSLERRKEGDIFQCPFCVGSSSLWLEEEEEERDDNEYREIFRVEGGWGYEISDFVLKRDENGCYGKTNKYGNLFHIFSLFHF